MPAHRLVRVVRQAFTVDDSLFHSTVAGQREARSISTAGLICVAGTTVSQSICVERRSGSPGPARVIRAVPCRSNVPTSMTAQSSSSPRGRLPAPLSKRCSTGSAVPQPQAQTGLGPMRYGRKARIVRAVQRAAHGFEPGRAQVVAARPRPLGECSGSKPMATPHLQGECYDVEP